MANEQQAIEAKKELKSLMTDFYLVSGIGYASRPGPNQTRDYGVLIRLRSLPDATQILKLPVSHTTKSNAQVTVQYLVPGNNKPHDLVRS